MKIILCGYMGAGKSLIGKNLAKTLPFHFVDLDDEIAKDQNLNISEIFAQKGEIFFRKTEAKVLREILKSEKNSVVALGGGTPCYGQNLQAMKKCPEAILIYLKMDIQSLTDRLFKQRNCRPLIKALENREKLEDFIRKHLFERQYYYLQSDYTIDCSSASPEESLEAILEKVES